MSTVLITGLNGFGEILRLGNAHIQWLYTLRSTFCETDGTFEAPFALLLRAKRSVSHLNALIDSCPGQETVCLAALRVANLYRRRG